MAILERFGAYAQDFERTYRDDDWTRLAQYFAPDAVYEVTGGTGCRITGREAIFGGMKKSLDGFDRHFRERRIELTTAPRVEGETLSVGWVVTYERDGAPPVPLRGRTEARYVGDTIARLSDTIENDAEVAAWLRTHGPGLDPSYV